MTLDRRAKTQWHLLMSPSSRRAWQTLHLGATPDLVAREASGLVYLATPYSREAVRDGIIWDMRLSLQMQGHAERHAAALAARGITAIAPIALAAGMCHQSHQLAPLDARFWQRWCAPLLAASRAVVVPDIPGWDRSQGIWFEVVEALDRQMPVYVYAGADEVLA